MEFQVIPGSPFLQLCFYGLAAAIVAGAAMLLQRGSIACGDPSATTAALQRRFLIGAAIWIAVVSAASFAGVLMPRSGRPPLPFLLMLAGVLALGVAISRSSVGDRLARGVPLAWLVGFQMFRFPLELAMHRAHTEGLMPVQMSYSGLNFDIATGISALVLAAAMLLTRVPRAIVHAWNVVGLILLANIVSVAFLSTPVFALFGPDRINVFITWMPYTLLPAVMVLAAWAGHLIVFRALR